MSRGSAGTVLKVFQTLAGLRGRLAEFRRELLRRRDAVAVEYAVECPSQGTGPVLSAYADATLEQGESIVWWLDVFAEPHGWRLVRHVRWNGQDELLPTVEVVAPDEEALLRELPTAVDALLGSREDVLHAALAVNGRAK